LFHRPGVRGRGKRKKGRENREGYKNPAEKIYRSHRNDEREVKDEKTYKWEIRRKRESKKEKKTIICRFVRRAALVPQPTFSYKAGCDRQMGYRIIL
jgi:hypothetical protein